MARTVAPLLSFSAGGQIAKTQVYAEWKGRPYVRRYVVPANPNSTGQQLTRNTFRYLNKLWQYLPSGAIAAWTLYGDNSRFTNRNGWLKQNIAPLRDQTDLALLVISPAAGSGIQAAAMNLTPGDDQITVDLTAPTLPAGWTITAAWALAVQNVNPQTSEIYDVASGSDATSTYQIILTGLGSAVEYVVGGWFEYTKSNGEKAYGLAITDTATTT